MRVLLLAPLAMVAAFVSIDSPSKAGDQEAREICQSLRKASAMGMNSGALMAGALFTGGGPKGKKRTWTDEFGIVHTKYDDPTPEQVADYNYTMNRVLEICPAYAQGFRF